MRELRPALVAIIDSLHTRAHTTLDISLPAVGRSVYLSSGQLHLDNFGTVRDYLALLVPEALEQDLGAGSDNMPFKVDNTDPAFGQTMTGADMPLAGNRATIGTLFLDPAVDIASGHHHYDPRMVTVLTAGEITEADVAFQAVSIIDATILYGRTISSEFPWREPLSSAPYNPNDIPPGQGGMDPTTGEIGPWGGRYPTYDPTFPGRIPIGPEVGSN